MGKGILASAALTLRVSCEEGFKEENFMSLCHLISWGDHLKAGKFHSLHVQLRQNMLHATVVLNLALESVILALI